MCTQEVLCANVRLGQWETGRYAHPTEKVNRKQTHIQVQLPIRYSTLVVPTVLYAGHSPVTGKWLIIASAAEFRLCEGCATVTGSAQGTHHMKCIFSDQL